MDFKKHIQLILVDDGSSDHSAAIIKKWQKKYPNNIHYCYKENGGLSSSRNFGLDYIERHNLSSDYLTFTDPDDILDKNYFWELDKFFTTYLSCQIASCNLIYFYEDSKIFKNVHPLKYRYNQTHIFSSANLEDDVLLSAAHSVYKISLLKEFPIRFDEKLQPSFEDCKFNNMLIVAAPNIDIGFIKDSVYFYRQRQNNSSLIGGAWSKVGLFTTVLSDGVLSTLQFAKQKLGYVPVHIQRVALYHCIGYYRRLLNANHHINFLSNEEKSHFDALLFEVFSYIDVDTIIKCTFPNLQNKHKVGLLNLYKNKKPPFYCAYINRIDEARKVINFSFFTAFKDEVVDVKLDNINQNQVEEKLISNYFLTHHFFYERRFAFKYENIEQNLIISVNNRKVNLTSFTKSFTGGDKISVLIECMRKKVIFSPVEDSWIIMDRKDKGDDNAEHFYRYLMNNYPNEKIFFAISKNCADWKRLKQNGFNLLNYDSNQFIKELKKCKYIVSSHLLIWNSLIKLGGSQCLTEKRKIWLQHGVICNDNSNVVNTKEIDLMITSTVPERESITNQLTRYNLLPSQVILTGLPRHDTLLEKSKNIKQEKLILVMPTWRTWLNKETIQDSEYFKFWRELLLSEKLNHLLKMHNYKLVFFPHHEINEYINQFNFGENVVIGNNLQGSMQDFFARAEVMITDYSSVAFEMAFLEKVVFYFQFDQEKFFSEHYEKGYFDFYKDGFGPVSKSIDNLLKELENYLDNKEKVLSIYQNRMNIFPNKKGDSSQQIYEKIKELN